MTRRTLDDVMTKEESDAHERSVRHAGPGALAAFVPFGDAWRAVAVSVLHETDGGAVIVTTPTPSEWSRVETWQTLSLASEVADEEWADFDDLVSLFDAVAGEARS